GRGKGRASGLYRNPRRGSGRRRCQQLKPWSEALLSAASGSEPQIQGQEAMENLDPASVEAQQTVVSEIFRSALWNEPELTLGALLKAYDVTIAKHGICASDLDGIQIYRALLQWGRQQGAAKAAGEAIRRPLVAVDVLARPLEGRKASRSPSASSPRAAPQPMQQTPTQRRQHQAPGRSNSRPPSETPQKLRGYGRGLSPAVEAEKGRVRSNEDTAETAALRGGVLVLPEPLPAHERYRRAPAAAGRSQSPPAEASRGWWPSASGPPAASETAGPLPREAGRGAGKPSLTQLDGSSSACNRAELASSSSLLPCAPSSAVSAQGRSLQAQSGAELEAAQWNTSAVNRSVDGAREPSDRAPHERMPWGSVESSAPRAVPTAAAVEIDAAAREIEARWQVPAAEEQAIPPPSAVDFAESMRWLDALQADALGALGGCPAASGPSAAWQEMTIAAPPAAAPPVLPVATLPQGEVALAGWQNEEWLLGTANATRWWAASPQQAAQSPQVPLPSTPPEQQPPGRRAPPPGVLVMRSRSQSPEVEGLLRPAPGSSFGASEARTLLADAFAYRRLLRRAVLAWHASHQQSAALRELLQSRQEFQLRHLLSAWSAASSSSAADRQLLDLRAAQWRARSELVLVQRGIAAWRRAAGRRAAESWATARVRQRLVARRLRLWLQAARHGLARKNTLQRWLLVAWQGAARRRRLLRAANSAHKQLASKASCHGALGHWHGFATLQRNLRPIVASATALGRRFELRGAMAHWHGRSSRRREASRSAAEAAAATQRRRRSLALAKWRAHWAPRARRAALESELCQERKRRSLGLGLLIWRVEFAAPRGILRRAMGHLGRTTSRYRTSRTFAAWRSAARAARSELLEVGRQRGRRLLQVSWEALRALAEQHRLMKVYKGWADVHWVRSRLCHGWTAWLAWRRKRGRVVALRSGSQLLAAWHWMRLHASARGIQSTGDQQLRLRLLHGGPVNSAAAELPAPRWQRAAAELLFGCAPFAPHPHHMKAMRPQLLALFISTLLRRMLGGWLREVRRLRVFHLRAKLAANWQIFGAWKDLAQRRLRARGSYNKVTSRFRARHRQGLLQGWHRRCALRAQLRHGASEFVTASRQRSCRRAFEAWCGTRAWEMLATAVQRVIEKKLALRNLQTTFQALTAWWQHERQAALMVRLSGLFLRKCSLRRGLQRLRSHVCLSVSQRAARKLRRQHLQCLWLRRWRSRQQLLHDLGERSKATGSWASSRLLRRICQAWATCARSCVKLRHLAIESRNARRHLKQLHSLRHWHLHVRAGAFQRSSAAHAAELRARHLGALGFGRWRRSCQALRGFRAALRTLRSQTLRELFDVWKQLLRQEQVQDICCIGRFVVTRFQHILYEWRREVLLAQLRGRLSQLLSARRLQLGLRQLRRRTFRRRGIRAGWRSFQARMARQLLAACLPAWLSEETATGRTGRSCLVLWQSAVRGQKRLRAKADLVRQMLTQHRAARTLASMRDAQASLRAGKVAAAALARRFLLAVLQAWRRRARSCLRCHHASLLVARGLRHRQRQAVIDLWQALHEARVRVRAGLSALHSRGKVHLLRASLLGWRSATSRASAGRVRLLRVA
ncbi:unnamed protein product, partial [Polarella glacialis]